ncbi:MAG: protein-L-isoaspartate O-methyltransferase [Hyphomicrobiales bacterium]|nr:protein-L-isoaspartate O-methyltransferase [Hyphomicrobiales bacterium]
MTDMSSARMAMINSQLRTNNVTDKDVLSAMATVPREQFVAAKWRPLAYLDRDIEIAPAESDGLARYLIKPMVFARLAQAAEIGTDDIVLDVGCGSGYSAAVLARVAGAVVALEENARLAERATANLDEIGAANATVVAAPAAAGHAQEGPYDAIIVEGSIDEVPATLLDQLKDGGRLVAVIGRGNAAAATVYTRSGKIISSRVVFNAALPQLPGFARETGFVF